MLIHKDIKDMSLFIVGDGLVVRMSEHQQFHQLMVYVHHNLLWTSR